ncbi:MAG: signal peptidase I [Zetaproteobacteria bacterium]|nr:signal peptidase I [Zetaproteobacteria bacterium]
MSNDQPSSVNAVDQKKGLWSWIFRRPKEKKEEPPFFSFENLSSLAMIGVVVFAVRWSFFSPYHVPTPSMEPVIKVGDRLVVSKLSYDFKIPFTDIMLFETGEVARGDIIVFRYPRDLDTDYVKRVIGLPGDKIKLVNDVLYINDQVQERINFEHDRSIMEDISEPQNLRALFKENLFGKKHWVMTFLPNARSPLNANWPIGGGTYVVPEDSVFVMGDNRDNSLDSRFWGKVPRSYIRGKAKFVLWSFHWPEGGSANFRFSRFGHMLDGDTVDDTSAAADTKE